MEILTLRPSGNVQGYFYYYSLVTGRRLHRRKCNPLPILKEAIDRVHSIAERQKTPARIQFLRRDGTIFDDVMDVNTLDDGGDDTSVQIDEAISSYESTHENNKN